MLAIIFAPSLSFAGVWFLFGVLGDVLPIMALVDVANKSKVAFYQADSSKTAWIIVLAIGLIFSPLGIFASGYYLLGVRRRVLRYHVGSDV